MVRKRPEALARLQHGKPRPAPRQQPVPVRAGRPGDGPLSSGGSPSLGMPQLAGTRPPAILCSCLKPEPVRESNALVCGVASIAALPLCFHPAGSFPALPSPQGQGRTESAETPQCCWGSLLAGEQPATVPETPASAGQYNRVSLAYVLFHLPKALKSEAVPSLVAVNEPS